MTKAKFFGILLNNNVLKSEMKRKKNIFYNLGVQNELFFGFFVLSERSTCKRFVRSLLWSIDSTNQTW